MTVLPIYDVLALPRAVVYLRKDTFSHLAGREAQEGEQLILVVEKEQIDRTQMRDDSFYPIGLYGQVAEIRQEGLVMIRTGSRVNIDRLTVYGDQTVELAVTPREDIEDIDEEVERARFGQIHDALIDFTDGFQWGPMARGYLSRVTTLGELGCAMSPWLAIDNGQRYALLAEDSVKARNDQLMEILRQNIELGKVNAEAQQAQEADYQRSYRENAIRRQIDYLQRQLDEMHPEQESDLRRFARKIEESGMNEEAAREAKKVLGRLQNEQQGSSESGLLYDYLEFVTSLNWKKQEAKEIDLKQAQRILDEDHYGLRRVKTRILQQIAVMSLKKQQSGSILLFVGAPGTGKTSVGRSIARALGRKYTRISLGGVRDEADIRGHRRTYIGAMPGRIMNAISKCGVSNPVMVLDEVDKLAKSYNGDPASALLEVLDPEQNSTFTDHYMNVPYDLSDVLFICTANTLDTIPEPLLNRMEVIHYSGYTPLEKQQIARRHLIPKALEAVGLTPEQFSISDEALQAVIDDYTREAGVRGLRKAIDTLCRVAAVRIVSGEQEKVDVQKEDLTEALDRSPIREDHVKQKQRPGIVTGMAWTAVGGVILYIQTLLTKGKGQLTVTGQLGDVMQESAKIALSLVRELYPEAAEILEKNDLHIHVPDGATPKDGPSAGITMTTALASLISGRAVDPHIAMTGEVSLSGEVGPIGGLPEKLMAAQRAGVTRVFIPADNVDDLREVADEVKQALEIIPVHRVREVLAGCGILEEESEQKEEEKAQ